MIFILYFLISMGWAHSDGATEPAELPLWEYGFGYGYLKLEQYPASDQYRSYSLPFPTFQYRGRILRADDQDGARAYLIKENKTSLEFSGTGFAPVESDETKARMGMKNIPLNILLGPQIVYSFGPGMHFEVGVFKSIATNFSHTEEAGEILQLQFDYRWKKAPWQGRLALTFQAGSKKFLDQYFTVKSDETWTDRSAFESRAGYLGSDIAYFQSYSVERTSLFLGLTYNTYANSINRDSPLHRADHSTSVLVGVAYVLGESQKVALPEDQIKGVKELIRK